MEELLKALNENANGVGLSINQDKTKYLEINVKRSNINRNTIVKMGQHNFERVQTFSFLGLIIKDNNVNSKEILTRIEKGSKAFFMKKICFHQSSSRNNPKWKYLYPL
jgi:hypothetical protein